MREIRAAVSNPQPALGDGIAPEAEWALKGNVLSVNEPSHRDEKMRVRTTSELNAHSARSRTSRRTGATLRIPLSSPLRKQSKNRV